MLTTLQPTIIPRSFRARRNELLGGATEAASRATLGRTTRLIAGLYLPRPTTTGATTSTTEVATTTLRVEVALVCRVLGLCETASTTARDWEAGVEAS